ncbi:iron-sulfur cluster co-chaperone protein HscB [Uranotaenia lowii]|uniref:iron-sulfur cluster co-chaperone protein HscB n=1 Tax=Uranotaenia lowii TaxID=190385 RepID=UPI0024790467|nr:iron-sulfur cluster co-chaperone protein HscB [Uranotaenia lowii]
MISRTLFIRSFLLTGSIIPRSSYCSSSKSCWSCSRSVVVKDKFFCSSCGSLLAVQNQDYFTLLDIPKTFELDSTSLTTSFRRLQSVLHPDKFSQKSEQEKENSLAWSSLVNKAYKTLNAPLERGKYLLQQDGIVITEENTSVDPDFLMEMMERNEQVEDATRAEDLTIIVQSLRSDIDQLYHSLRVEFAKADMEKAKTTLVRLKYLLNIERTIKDKLLELQMK